MNSNTLLREALVKQLEVVKLKKSNRNVEAFNLSNDVQRLTYTSTYKKIYGWTYPYNREYVDEQLDDITYRSYNDGTMLNITDISNPISVARNLGYDGYSDDLMLCSFIHNGMLRFKGFKSVLPSLNAFQFIINPNSLINTNPDIFDHIEYVTNIGYSIWCVINTPNDRTMLEIKGYLNEF